MAGGWIHCLDRVPDLAGLAATAPAEFPYLLDDASGRGRSILFQAGPEVLVRQADGRIEGPGRGSGFFERLENWYLEERREADGNDAGEPGFCGGWFLYIGYEMAGEIEPTLRLPPQDTGMPDAFAHRCPAAVVVEPDADGCPRARAVAESETALTRLLSTLESVTAAEPRDELPGLADLSEEDPEHFRAGVRSVLEYLAAGDVFQVNISRGWTGRFQREPDPVALYRALRRTNPAPFAGLMRWGRSSLISSSPERLVEIRGDRVQTRPIAGTRPRGANQEQDQAMSRELIGNLKERAEHIMLIDLERNDLGRVCRPGTVEVNELMVIESHAHVHHIVSNVRGRLREEATPVQAIQAVFPGGTITGCPKVRCMQIIAELERAGRGFYTGSMGYLGRDGRMDMNILIRSLLTRGNAFSFRTGAGIVADSQPDLELRETEDKARGLLLALQREPDLAAHV
ncbi:aminodeoxychorismate synthase component I [Elongatibacter sediminis]|uniref:Aminodeoxychorismate synthase component I n=1 Tax=Elongatibacter sediminis TaxID=3119006 RepID=A0AAW9RL77_9GAMM